MRRTKIVATVGPAAETPERIRELLLAGVDVFRLNFSHGTHESHAAAYRAIRDAIADAGRIAAVLQDLSGPKIRTGALAGGRALALRPGDELRIAAGDQPGTEGRVFTTYTPLIESAKRGDRLLLDDGRIELRVVDVRQGEIATTVVNGGSLGEHKGINAPGISLPASAVTAKDERDLRFGLELGVDLVALSFVQTAADVEHVQRLMRAIGRTVPIIAKIERPAGVDNLDSILRVAGGTMVARGDLGLEMPLEQVPRVQKVVIRRTRTAGLPVILATQVLESMRVERRPTRAEVSDAANAVEEGVDAIMLAGETAAGNFPVRAVETLDAVIRDAELMPSIDRVAPARDAAQDRHALALCEAAVTLAAASGADAIVAFTREGHTARLLAALRPSMQVFAAATDPGIAAACALLWGITPIALPADVASSLSPTALPAHLEHVLIDRGLVRAGATLVVVNVSSALDRTDSNFVNLQRVG